MPYVVGLTGGIGSGKSAAGDEFARLGVPVVDSDAIAHELTGPGGAAVDGIRTIFGPETIGPDGAMDRARMRALVFSDPDVRARLEGFLHPLIREHAKRRIASAHSPYVIHMVPLLVESGNFRDRCDRILVVDCTEEVQLLRVARRSGLSESEIRRIMSAQATRQARLNAADDVIDNSGSIDALRKQVLALHPKYLELAKKTRSQIVSSP